MIDAIHVKAHAGRKLELTFEDGLESVVDMELCIEKLHWRFCAAAG